MSTSCFTVPFYAGVAYAMALGLRLPVCLSQVRIVLKQRNVGSCKQYQPQDSFLCNSWVSSIQLPPSATASPHILHAHSAMWQVHLITRHHQAIMTTLQTDRQAGRQTGRQAGRQTDCSGRETHKSNGQDGEQGDDGQLFETSGVFVSQHTEVLARYQADLIDNKLLWTHTQPPPDIVNNDSATSHPAQVTIISKHSTDTVLLSLSVWSATFLDWFTKYLTTYHKIILS